jgi:hypothetical protein
MVHFRVADRQRLGRQFAHHDVQEGNHAERHHERERMDHRDRGDAHGQQHRLHQARESRLADPAQAQRGERDAQLAGRQVGVELAVDLAEDASAHALAFGDGAHAGFAQSDDAELGSDEEAVQHDQENGEQNQQYI